MADSKDIDVPRNLIEQIIKLLMGLLSEMALPDEAHTQSPRERARKLALEASPKTWIGTLV